ncbi:uncharacterized protein [Amphiura filiformis]|uniref:uncharacterized protein n=1 Tax=Amphiura filiformis TaxID=82378 RepID=UPI003B21639E
MAHHFSTEGLSRQWQPRRLKRHTDEDSEDNPLLSLVKKTLGEETTGNNRGPSYSFRNRPDDDGNIEKLTKTRKKKSTTQNGNIRNVFPEQYNIPPENQPIEDPHQQLQMLMENLVEQNEYQLSAWESRQVEYEANWLAHRQIIFQHMLELEAPPEEKQCDGCSKELAMVRCFDCIGSYLCTSCDHIIHSCNPMHNRCTWDNGFLEFLPQDFPLPADPPSRFLCFKCNGTACTSEPHKDYIIITLRGRFDVGKFRTRCSQCGVLNPEYDLANIINKGFWPGNPDMSKSDYLFDRKLLEMWQHIYRHLPGSSLAGFIAVLNDISASHGRKSTINHPMFSRAIAEYANYLSELDMIKHQDHLKCPPCTINQHSAHVDGNHKLYRYKHVPKGTMEPYHNDRFIVDDAPVTKHMKQVYDAHPSKSKSTYNDIYCGNSKWKAARETTSRHSKLDETGLVVVGCRHAIAQKAVNMHAGELYGYSHYLHIHFLMQQSVDYLFQDIMCKYWLWANKVGTTSSLWQEGTTCIKPALSVFHAKAHSWHCQVSWGGRYVEGAGAGAGEDMEQAFSHLSRIGNTTKYMNTGGRIDMITDHVLYWNSRKIKTMPVLLCKRYKNVRMKLEEVESEKRNLADKCDRDVVPWKRWTKEVIQVAKDVSKSSDLDPATSKLLQQKFILQEQLRTRSKLEDFIAAAGEGLTTVLGMVSLFDLIQDEIKDKKAKEKKLADVTASLRLLYPHQDVDEKSKVAAVNNTCSFLQADIELLVNAVNQRLQAIADLADTSKKRAAYKAKIAKDKKNLEKQLKKLCSVEALSNGNSKYEIDKILKGEFPWQTTAVDADWTTKKRAADLHMLHERLMEEEPLLVREMHDFLQFQLQVKHSLEHEIEELQLKLDELNQGSDQEMQGCDQELMTQESSLRYSPNEVTKPAAIKGLIAMKRKGIAESRSHIQTGLGLFGRITGDGYRDLVFDTEFDEEEEIVLDEEEEEHIFMDEEEEEQEEEQEEERAHGSEVNNRLEV